MPRTRSLGLRAFLQLNRALRLSSRVLEWAERRVTEVPLLLFRTDWAHEATLDHYRRARAYRRPAVQGLGLYPFEARALARFFPPPPARLLVHGCGGGRELLALARAGYQLEAYEPVFELGQAAERALTSHGLGPTQVGRLGIKTWAQTPTGPFDGVVVGWSAWGHLIHQADRLAALRTMAQATPCGPILLSFYCDAFFDHTEVSGKPRPLLTPASSRTRRALERLQGAPPVERGTAWARGFYCHLTEEWELREEAALAGCEVLHYEHDTTRCPNAVLRAAPSHAVP